MQKIAVAAMQTNEVRSVRQVQDSRELLFDRQNFLHYKLTIVYQNSRPSPITLVIPEAVPIQGDARSRNDKLITQMLNSENIGP